MTERKTFKRRVRERMEKTGERYTAARRHVAEPEREPPGGPAEPATAAPDDLVRRRTGKSQAEWFALLDAWGATERPHREVARHLREEHGVSGWWAQNVTVEYERARGLRAKHERPDGFAVSATKTVAVPVERLYAAFVEEDERVRWLARPMRLRTARPTRSARFDWGDGATRVHVHFTAKGPAKSSVSVQHERLPDADDAEAAKAAWRERLARLQALLEGREADG